MAEVRIAAVDGPEVGKDFELAGSLTVGRDPEGGIVIDDPEASRRHATLTVQGSHVAVEDLGSTNGTFVNGERIAGRQELRPGDKLRIGTTTFELRAPSNDATQVGAVPVPADLDATAQRPVPDFSSAPPPPGPPSAPPPAASPPPVAAPPPAYAPPPAPPPGGPPAPYYGGGGFGAAYPASYEADYPAAGIARWRCFFQGLLAYPHVFVLGFVWIGAFLAYFVAWFAILFTRRYPRGIFDFIAGTLRWGHRVTAYTYLMTEQYPPFSLEDSPYPIRVRIDYPEAGIARWRPFAHYFMSWPHVFVLWFLYIGAFLALIGAWFSILFTRRYPPGIFNFVNGVLRWQLRVQAFSLLMTEQYPPFSLD